MNFGYSITKIQQKYEREREKVGERECMNFGNLITEIPVARLAYPSACGVCSKWDVLKKKTNCGNTIEEIGKKKKILWQLWQCIAERGEEKKIVVTEIRGGIKKISATSIIFLQYFHNKSHVISY